MVLLGATAGVREAVQDWQTQGTSLGAAQHLHLSYSLNSLKGVIQGTTIGIMKEDNRSLDYSSFQAMNFLC